MVCLRCCEVAKVLRSTAKRPTVEHMESLKAAGVVRVIVSSHVVLEEGAAILSQCGPVQAKAATGKAVKPAASQQVGAKGKEGSSNAAVAARLLSASALTEKVLEWAPEVGLVTDATLLPLMLDYLITGRCVQECMHGTTRHLLQKRKVMMCAILKKSTARQGLLCHCLSRNII